MVKVVYMEWVCLHAFPPKLETGWWSTKVRFSFFVKIARAAVQQLPFTILADRQTYWVDICWGLACAHREAHCNSAAC